MAASCGCPGFFGPDNTRQARKNHPQQGWVRLRLFPPPKNRSRSAKDPIAFTPGRLRPAVVLPPSTPLSRAAMALPTFHPIPIAAPTAAPCYPTSSPCGRMAADRSPRAPMSADHLLAPARRFGEAGGCGMRNLGAAAAIIGVGGKAKPCQPCCGWLFRACRVLTGPKKPTCQKQPRVQRPGFACRNRQPPLTATASTAWLQPRASSHGTRESPTSRPL